MKFSEEYSRNSYREFPLGSDQFYMSIWRDCNVTNTRANQKNSDSLLVVVRLFLITGRHAAGSSSSELNYT